MSDFKKPGILILFISLMVGIVNAQNLDYYLPDDIIYNPEIPTPKEILGYQVGEWHASHDQVVYYMQRMAEMSPRITIEEYARTYENRPLLLLTITSPENHRNLEEIRTEHLKLSDPKQSANLDLTSMPAVIWMGYSVHGNEPSGGNAALLAVYHLAAAEGEEIEELLQNTIILVDPVINADGFNRFANWVNMHKSHTQVSDPANRELNEMWPGGRTNHYWFDLNRDWLPVQHPESQGRIRKVQAWKPNILTDHHEMQTYSTFFFQPGIPSRNNPLTPLNTYVLTRKIADYHARYLDKIGSLYYTEENYDDYYYGKGSTYPDINGGVGILFEQASSRGHAQDSENGVVTFPFTIRNQFTTTLSTLKAGADLRTELLEHQRTVYQQYAEEAADAEVQGYIFSAGKDRSRNREFIRILLNHGLEVHQLAKNLNLDGASFEPETSYVVPTAQNDYKLVQTIFEKVTEFPDSLFYDVSAWTLPLAFNLEYRAVNKRNYNDNLLGARIDDVPAIQGELIGGKSNYAYLVEWFDYNAPNLLYKLLDQDLIVKVATLPFAVSGGRNFERGTLMIPVSLQEMDADDLYKLLQELASATGIDIFAANTGITTKGIDFGSRNFDRIQTPKVFTLVEGGVRSYEAGEVWHLLDQRLQIPLVQVPFDNFSRLELSKYNTLVLPDGGYSVLSENMKGKLRSWLSGGGQIIAIKRGAKWLSQQGLTNVGWETFSPDSTGPRPYEDIDKYKDSQKIGGAIFNSHVDLTNPLGFGFQRPELSIFKDNDNFMKRTTNPYANPVIYTEDPLQSGYISEEKYEKVKNAAVITVSDLGRGRIISFSDNPLFRAFWYGSNRLFFNSLFFGNLIDSDAAE